MMISASRGSMQAFEQLRWVSRRLDLADREPLPSSVARQALLAVMANRIVATPLVVLIAG